MTFYAADVVPATGNCWSSEAKNYFNSACNEKRLVSRIMYVDREKNLTHTKPSVLFELYDTNEDDTDISIDEE